MKLSLKILSLSICLLCATTCFAQTFVSRTPPTTTTVVRGAFGTYQSSNFQAGQICAVVTNTVTPVASGKLDTLNGVDTGYVQFYNCLNKSNNLDMLFDYAVTKISGTVAGTALLQGSLDNATWFTITGNTTYCAACQGASATITNTTGTKHYQWYVPHSATDYPYYQVQAITSGTMTASYNGYVQTKY